MKNIRMAATALTCCLAMSAYAQSAPQIYGSIRLALTHSKAGVENSRQAIDDNASRIGFKGAEDLGNGLKVVYGLELGLDASTGNTASTLRNSFVGLTHPQWGNFALGRLDSSTAAGSPLYSQISGIVSFAANDAGLTAIGTRVANGRNRVSNAVGYMSPALNGWTVRARYYLRGENTATAAENDAQSLDIGVDYRNSSLRAVLGYGKDKRKGGLRNNEFDQKWQTGLRLLSLGAVQPYILYGQDRYHATGNARRKVNYWIVGARFENGPHAVVANITRRDVQNNKIAQRKNYQVGYTYQMSKRTQLQAYYDYDGVDSSRQNASKKGLGFGVRHNF